MSDIYHYKTVSAADGGPQPARKPVSVGDVRSRVSTVMWAFVSVVAAACFIGFLAYVATRSGAESLNLDTAGALGDIVR